MGNKSRLIKKMKKEQILFICTECKCEEYIPKGVVDYFDEIDDGDRDFAPRFSCKKCNGLMEPEKYKGVTGIVYEYKEN